jgi:hypothetical protein
VPGECARVEVINQGGAWTSGGPDDERGRGLAIAAAISGDGNWGIEGGTASRAIWVWLK